MQEHNLYKGLTSEEVIQSRATHGTNVFTAPERTPVWKKFLEKFTDPLIIILLANVKMAHSAMLYDTERGNTGFGASGK